MAIVNKAPVSRSQSANMKRIFIGSCWKNLVRKDGKNSGVEFLNLRLSRGVEITLSESDQITLWPNKKREGRQDADYRASIQVPA